MVAHAFNPSTWEAETGRFLKFGASLIYRVSSRTARAIQRNPVLKNQKTNKQKNKQTKKKKPKNQKNQEEKQHREETVEPPQTLCPS